MTAAGKKTNGFINADSYELAKSRLRKDNIFVTSVTECEEVAHTELTDAQRLQFTRDCASLLRSGLPLYESLVTIEEKYAKTKVHSIFLDVCDQVKLGKSLSAALKRHPKSFDDVYCAVIEAGEHTGNLEGIFAHIEKLYSRQEKLKKQLLGALLYPAFLFTFCSLVLFVLLFFMIPTMKDMYEGKNLHPVTQIVIGVSDFLTNYWPLILLWIAGVGGGLALYMRSDAGKERTQRLLLSVPLVRRILMQSSLLRFAHVLAVLLKSGVSLLDGLRLGRKVVHNIQVQKAIEEAEEMALEGGSISQSMATCPLFPSLFIRMLSVAEESGNMEAMLFSIANIYDEELERSLTRFTTLLQPIILLVLGVIVGVVLIAVLLPMSDVSALLD